MNELFGILILFAPLFLIVWLANLAEYNRSREMPYENMAVFSYALVVLLYVGALIVGVSLQGLSLLQEQNPDILKQVGLTLEFDSLALMGAGIWMSAVVGLLLLTPWARRLAAKFMPIDPASPVHAVALALTLLVVINLAATLGIGLGNLSESLQAQTEAGSGSQGAATTISLWGQQIITALWALVGVGWAVRRSWGQSLRRLGITPLTGRRLLIGLGLGLAMVPVVVIVEYIASTLLGVGVDPDVESLTEQLIGPLFSSPFGILTLGLAAALGEETIFRGALQPRFGLIFTSLLFALVHSNYGITMSTLIVFVLGCVLGLVRLRYSTSTSMVVHAVYNMALGLIAYLNLSFLDT
ncbi:MAG: type II CAAX endopeptidase family protein [Caldilineaceae bacterium]